VLIEGKFRANRDDCKRIRFTGVMRCDMRYAMRRDDDDDDDACAYAYASASPLLPIERWIEHAPGYRALCRWGTGGAAMNTSDYSFRFVWFITGNLI